MKAKKPELNDRKCFSSRKIVRSPTVSVRSEVPGPALQFSLAPNFPSVKGRRKRRGCPVSALWAIRRGYGGVRQIDKENTGLSGKMQIFGTRGISCAVSPPAVWSSCGIFIKTVKISQLRQQKTDSKCLAVLVPSAVDWSGATTCAGWRVADT